MMLLCGPVWATWKSAIAMITCKVHLAHAVGMRKGGAQLCSLRVEELKEFESVGQGFLSLIRAWEECMITDLAGI